MQGGGGRGADVAGGSEGRASAGCGFAVGMARRLNVVQSHVRVHAVAEKEADGVGGARRTRGARVR